MTAIPEINPPGTAEEERALVLAFERQRVILHNLLSWKSTLAISRGSGSLAKVAVVGSHHQALTDLLFLRRRVSSRGFYFR